MTTKNLCAASSILLLLEPTAKREKSLLAVWLHMFLEDPQLLEDKSSLLPSSSLEL